MRRLSHIFGGSVTRFMPYFLVRLQQHDLNRIHPIATDWSPVRLASTAPENESRDDAHRCPVCQRCFAGESALGVHLSLRHGKHPSSKTCDDKSKEPSVVKADVPTEKSLLSAPQTPEQALERVLKVHTAALHVVKLANTLCKLNLELAAVAATQRTSNADASNDQPMSKDVRPFGGPIETCTVQPPSGSTQPVRVGSSRTLQVLGRIIGPIRFGKILTTPVSECVVRTDQFFAGGLSGIVPLHITATLVRLYGSHATRDLDIGDTLLFHGFFGLHPAFQLDEGRWVESPVLHVFGSQGSVTRIYRPPATESQKGSTHQP